MLTEEEEKFLAYWSKERVREKKGFSLLSPGLPIGLLIGLGIVLNLMTGWYTRATMVANSQSTPGVLIFSIILIVVFYGVFYKKHKREMNEQRFLELTKKKEKQNSSGHAA